MSDILKKVSLALILVLLLLVIGYEAYHYGFLFPGPDFDPLRNLQVNKPINNLAGYEKLCLEARR